MNRRFSSLLIAVAIVFGPGVSFGADLMVSKTSIGEGFSAYIKDVLKLISEKTEGGPINIKPTDMDMSQDRALQSLREGKDIDLFWTMTSKDREKGLRVIRIPLLRGLLGNRIFIIRKGDQAKFDKVKTMDDLKKLSLGQGHDWPDTFILESAGLKVEKSPNYQGLFPMLDSGRFDAFPRGVNEPWTEVEKNIPGKLEIEKKLAVSYLAPLFFFVNPNNKALAERLEKGLKAAIADGSFEKLFNQHWGEFLTKANMKERTIFKIDNPFLSDETKNAMAENPKYLLSFEK